MHARTMKVVAGAGAIAGLAAFSDGRTRVTAAVADEGPALQSVGSFRIIESLLSSQRLPQLERRRERLYALSV